MYQHKYIISRRRPLLCLFFLLAAAFISAATVWFVLNQQSFKNEYTQLQAEYAELTEINQTQQIKLTEYEQRLAIQQTTDEQLRADLQEQQQTIQHLNKELMFYQSITQGNISTALQIQELHLFADELPQRFRYRLVITQGKKINKALTGDITISVNTASTTLQVNEHDLNLRYVQVLDGIVELTENEKPTQIAVQLKQNGKVIGERSFDWIIQATNTL